MQKEINNLEFFQGVTFEFINSFKNEGYKYMLIFDDSFGKLCNAEEFVDIATVGRRRAFSAIYIKHNLFYRSKQGWEVSCKTHTLFFPNHPVMCMKLLH